MANYESANGSFPMAFFWQWCDAQDPAARAASAMALGRWSRCLPYYEQGPLWNAYNTSVEAFGSRQHDDRRHGRRHALVPQRRLDSGRTIHLCTAGSTTRCPHPMCYTNYRGNWGYWTGIRLVPTTPVSRYATHRLAALQQFNGVIVSNGYGAAGRLLLPVQSAPMSFAHLSGFPAVTDGTSNTAAFSEIAHGFLSKTDGSFNCWNWWTSGNLGDSTYAHFYPINPQKKLNNLLAIDQAGTFVNGASSFHPGGVNVAFTDGSVRFIKESIDCWTFDPTTGLSAWCDSRYLGVDRGHRRQGRRLAGPRLGERR